MTEDQLYSGIVVFCLLLTGPVGTWLFWLKNRKNQQDRAVAYRLKRGKEAEYARMDEKYQEGMERRSGCFDERFEEEEDSSL